MEGSLPIIGSMPEAPAALTKTPDPASASNPFAALLAQPVDDPAGVPGGTGLPPSGLPLPPVPAVLNPVGGPANIDLPVSQALPPADPVIQEMLNTQSSAIDMAAGEDALIMTPLAAVTVEADGKTQALPQTGPGLGTAIPSGGPDGGAPVAAPPPVEAARQFVAEADLTAAGRSDDPGSLRSQERPTPYTSQAVLRDPPAPATNPAAAAMATRTDLAGSSASAAVAVAVPVQQAGTQTESAGAETLDMPDLPFDSIRVSVRDPAADRPMANREPAFHLPGPRQALGHPQWARALGERLAVVVRGEHQTARMSLNPAHLGPIDIQLRLQDDQAQLWLTAQHPQARDALEAAIPRLREMFAQQGIDLSQQGTSGQQREQSADARPEQPTDDARTGPDREDADAPALLRPRGGGLLDHYA